jgi:choline-phosphate cytidylyltransferase
MNNEIITFGTFDLFHIGHIKLLKRARELGNRLIVGVSSDILNIKKKQRVPVFNQDHRMQILLACKFVDEVFLEESLEKKSEYVKNSGASIFVIGDDWKGKFDYIGTECNVKVIYLPRTSNVSTTALMSQINNNMFGYFKLNGSYAIKPVPINEIFPLKKYKFHDRMLWGPNKYKAMSDYYNTLMPSGKRDIMRYAYRKWNKNKAIFEIKKKDRVPAKLELDFNGGCSKDTKKCLIRANGRSKHGCYFTPLCCTRNMCKLLFDVTDLLDKHKIIYFIYWGTLLGSIRHGGMIPWDTDVDIYILEPDVKKLENLSDTIKNELGYHFTKEDDGQFRVYYSKLNKRHLDIYLATF